MISTESVKTWLVKHVVSPMDRVSFRLTGGRLRLTVGRPVLLLSTVGRRTGQVRATPMFYLRDGADLVVCNVRPPGERTNPWPQNLDHQPTAEVTVEGRRQSVRARRATREEVNRLWPHLVRIWPLYADYYRHTNERHIFVLTPRTDAEDPGRRYVRCGLTRDRGGIAAERHLEDTGLSVPCVSDWPVVDDGDAFPDRGSGVLVVGSGTRGRFVVSASRLALTTRTPESGSTRILTGRGGPGPSSHQFWRGGRTANEPR